ncbi:cytochrome c oxidase [Coemansia biformis]|uniref:Cytochrome c oxidase n=1 Tax=Coemansia biformis TaxID=1286918 RepID=A0A9W7YAX0_9FUNG|nr:cytochrome c oxidase [Coemansia biformis]
MFANAAARATRLSGRRLQSTTANSVLAQANETFGKLPEVAQREELKRLGEIMKADWHKVSLADKQAVPKPRTMTKEWQEASNRYAKEHNMNPISGISSEGYKGKGFVQSS